MLAQEKGAAYRRGRAGSPATVVVEGEGGTGLTEDYLRVDVAEADISAGALVRGTLLARGDQLYIEAPRASAPIPA